MAGKRLEERQRKAGITKLERNVDFTKWERRFIPDKREARIQDVADRRGRKESKEECLINLENLTP